MVSVNSFSMGCEAFTGGDGMHPIPGGDVSVCLYKSNTNGIYENYATLGNIHVEPGQTLSNSLSLNAQNIPHGNYKLAFEWSFYPSGASSYFTAIGITFKWERNNLIRRVEYGQDGFLMFYNVNGEKNYFHLSETEGLSAGGKTNMPGVLLSGTVNSGGGGENFWGAKQATSPPVRNSTGR